MGHRALLAYERDDRGYDVRYSHWGGDLDLRASITGATPFGRRPPGSHGDPPVDPVPIAVARTLADVVTDHLDVLVHEALYVVSTDYEVTEYRVLPFLVPTADGLVEGPDGPGRGALVETSPFDPGRGYVRGWFDGVRGLLGELVDRRVLAPEDVPGCLEDRLRRFAADREVIVDPAEDL